MRNKQPTSKDRGYKLAQIMSIIGNNLRTNYKMFVTFKKENTFLDYKYGIVWQQVLFIFRPPKNITKRFKREQVLRSTGFSSTIQN